jgi:hypothetical protein
MRPWLIGTRLGNSKYKADLAVQSQIQLRKRRRKINEIVIYLIISIN